MVVDERAVCVVEAVYTGLSSNDRRHELVEELQHFEKCSTGDVLFDTGMFLMFGLVRSHPAVQAYGCVILRNALRAGKISANTLPQQRLMGVLGMHSEGVPKLVQHDVIELICEMCLFLWPQSWTSLIDDLFCEGGFRNHIGLQHCLSAIVRVFLDPDRTKKRTSAIRKAFAAVVPVVMAQLIQCVFEHYERLSAGAGNLELGIESVKICLGVVTDLSATVAWADMGVDRMLLALMDVAPLAHDALCCAASMLQDSPISADAINALAFAATVLQKVELTVGAQNWPLTAELLALASNLRRETQKLLRDPLVNFCGIVLSVPSVMFAASALEILHKVMNRYELPEALIDPTPLLSSILAISPKFLSHPKNASISPSASFSQWQFSSGGEYDQCFAELRNHARALLEHVAEISSCAEICCAFLHRMISNLVSEPLKDDFRTPSNTVIQQSNTYVQWEVCFFFVEGLAASLTNPLAAARVEACALKLFERVSIVQDPVVAPVFLNIMLVFLKAHHREASSQIWKAGIGVLKQVLTIHTAETEDVRAARKRALTVLIDTAETHSAAIVASLPDVDDLLQQLSSTVVRRPAEKLLLTEIIACFINSAQPRRQEVIFFQLTELPKEIIAANSHCLTTPYALAGWLIAAEAGPPLQTSNLTSVDGLCTFVPTREGISRRQDLKDAVVVIAAVLRRCRERRLFSELITALGHHVIQLVHLFHQLTPKMLPPQHSRILLHDDRKNQNDLPALFFSLTRDALYQCCTEFGKFGDYPTFAAPFAHILDGTSTLSPSNFRSLLNLCITPVCNHIPQLLETASPAITGFLQQHNVFGFAASHNHDLEIVDQRILFYLSKDILRLLNDLVIIPKGHTRDTTALNVAVSILTSLLSCGADVKSAAIEVCSVADGVSEENRCAVLVHVMACARDHRARKHVFDTIITSVADAFVRQPMAGLLIAGGMPADDAAELIKFLEITPLAELRRRKVVDSLKSLCC